MPLPQLQPRLNQLPLVLAGPLLRRTTADEVTVWFALKAARKVTVSVREAGAAGAALATGTRGTVAVGSNLHIVAVTAKPPAAAPLRPGRTYVYDAAFGPADGNDAAPVTANTETLLVDGVVAADAAAARALLTYADAGGPPLPSFAIAADSPANLRVLHTSCRKPHADGDDALASADAIVASAIATPDRRPQLLLLTGDQIYADDVADVLLAVATDAAKVLLGFDEVLPTADADPTADDHPVAADFAPGERKKLITGDGKLTSEDGGSHLLSFGEFCAMYLLAFGTAIWPEALPVPADFPAASQGFFADRRRTDELRAVKTFWRTLPAVRRALANIPTLTIFDDHEVTDDWNLRGTWSKAVLTPGTGSKLGRRIVQNGLAAYALFQAWGNTPAQFAATGADGQAGRDLLAALADWDGIGDASPEIEAIRVGLGLPTGFTGDSVAEAAPGAVRWHYALNAPSFQLLALDTRTHRSSPGGENEPAALMGAPDALQQQLRDVPLPAADVPVLVVSATPVFGNPLMEWLVRLGQSLGMPLFFDAETWGLQPAARERFLSALLTRGTAGGDGVKRQRVVLLCGDVHYGFSARVGYRGSITPSGDADAVRATVAQLTASPAKNESGKTRFLHWIGFMPFGDAIPHETVVGFANLGGGSVTLGTGPGGALNVTGTPAFLALPDDVTPAANADWRYDVEFLLADTESDANRGAPATVVATPPPGDRTQALGAFLGAAGVHAKEYVGKFGSGKEIVGRNTIGEVTFTWGDADDAKAVVHELWWALPDTDAAFPLSRWSIPLANGLQAGAGIRLHVADAAGNAAPLANAWVYVRGGAPATLTTLRTEADGRLVQRKGAVRDAPEDYDREWVAVAGSDVTIAFTRGARPVPEAVLDRAALAGAFRAATIPALDPAGRATISIPDARIDVTRPADLDLWPLLWQSPDANLPWLAAGAGGIDADGRTYEKAGLPQRDRAFVNPAVSAAGNLRVVDGGPSAVPAEARARPRGLRVEATVPADVSAATVELLGANGLTVRQRDGFAPTAALRDTVPAVLAAPAGDRRALTADVLIDPDAVAGALGHVQVLITCTTPAGPRFEAAAALLTGIQLALVDDPAPGTRGTPPTEADDVVILDFGADEQADGTSAPASPQRSPAALADTARVRRMRRYEFGVYEALYDPAAAAHATANPTIPKPRMPRLMAELQLAGADRTALTDLMRRRWLRRDADPSTVRPVELLELVVEADWRMLLSWTGMDARAGVVGGGYNNPHIAHSHRTEVTGTSTVTLRFAQDGALCDPSGVALTLPADNSVPGAMPAVAVPPWVEAGRRRAAVLVAEQRRWGREAGAANVGATVVEWLPLVERVRGGDGRLELSGLRIGRESGDTPTVLAVHGGLVPGAAAADIAEAGAGLVPARLPRFRVVGVNPTDAQIEALVLALINRVLPGLRANPEIALLHDDCWRETARRIVDWENGHHGQYDPDPPRVRNWTRAGVVFSVGRERGMPTFGPPHGYGLGQLDNWNAPPVGPDANMVWDFVSNAEQVLHLLLTDKAPSSLARLNTHPLAAAASAADRARFRALHQRETVRRYNGANEFEWNAASSAWVINPPLTLDPSNVPYPNQVLGTGVNYGAPRPITFTNADFGPGSATPP